MSDDSEQERERKALESMERLRLAAERRKPGEPIGLPHEILERIDRLISYSRLLLAELHPTSRSASLEELEIPESENSEALIEELKRQGLTQEQAMARAAEFGFAFNQILRLTRKPVESHTALERESVSCLQDLYGPLASFEYFEDSDPN